MTRFEKQVAIDAFACYAEMLNAKIEQEQRIGRHDVVDALTIKAVTASYLKDEFQKIIGVTPGSCQI